VTLDTGALIALEAAARGKSGNGTAVRLAKVLATRDDLLVRTPSVVVGEWWRGQHGAVAGLLDRHRIRVDSVDMEIAKRAGRTLADITARDERERRGMLVDAIVVVTAAQLGHVVYTADVDDLERIRDLGNFDVKILRI
jgi:predicted nucleic acid-binding protein